jgi:hypothetical protein
VLAVRVAVVSVVGAAGAAGAEAIIALLYGAEYAAATPLLRWLALTAVSSFVNYALTHGVIAHPRVVPTRKVVGSAIRARVLYWGGREGMASGPSADTGQSRRASGRRALR